jgi:formate hydrogenlyase transcriptional activator
MDKRIDVIPPDTMEAWVRYQWPGNARESQNSIERAVILSPPSVLRAPTSERTPFPPHQGSQGASMNGLAEVERDHILRVFKASHWGISGAAARLGMKGTSLASRMKKLRIRRPAASHRNAAAAVRPRAAVLTHPTLDEGLMSLSSSAASAHNLVQARRAHISAA